MLAARASGKFSGAGGAALLGHQDAEGLVDGAAAGQRGLQLLGSVSCWSMRIDHPVSVQGFIDNFILDTTSRQLKITSWAAVTAADQPRPDVAAAFPRLRCQPRIHPSSWRSMGSREGLPSA